MWSANSVWKKYRLRWMSSSPGSQYRFNRFTLVMEMSPSPLSLPGSHTVLYTPVPVLHFCHMASE